MEKTDRATQDQYPQYFDMQLARAIADLHEAEESFKRVAHGMSDNCIAARQAWVLAMANIRSAMGLAMALNVTTSQDLLAEIERAFLTAEI